MAQCNKCQNAPPHGSDSWCLSCACHEQLGIELKGAWGSGGSRSVASDLIASCLRQVRALRRLGLAAGSGSVKPAEPPGPPPGFGAAPPSGAPAPSKPRATSKASGAKSVKEEDDEADEESTEGSESEEPERDEVATTPKARAVPPSTHKGEERSRGRSSRRVREHRRREEAPSSGHRDREGHRRSRSRGEREELPRRRSKDERRSGEHVRSGRRRRRPGHRGGSRHQRLYRAEEDPYKRFHLKQPDSFWDQEHFSR